MFRTVLTIFLLAFVAGKFTFRLWFISNSWPYVEQNNVKGHDELVMWCATSWIYAKQIYVVRNCSLWGRILACFLLMKTSWKSIARRQPNWCSVSRATLTSALGTMCNVIWPMWWCTRWGVCTRPPVCPSPNGASWCPCPNVSTRWERKALNCWRRCCWSLVKPMPLRIEHTVSPMHVGKSPPSHLQLIPR